MPTAWDEVVALADETRVVGVGETGLDRHWDDTPFAVQEEYFVRHLELGRRLNKPVVIHCREAEADVLRMLRAEFDRHGPIRGVMHSFVGDWATAEACLAMGLYLSFAGMLTYKNAEALREVAAKQPLDRLLVETDCPYLSPVPLRGQAERAGERGAYGGVPGGAARRDAGGAGGADDAECAGAVWAAGRAAGVSRLVRYAFADRMTHQPAHAGRSPKQSHRAAPPSPAPPRSSIP